MKLEMSPENSLKSQGIRRQIAMDRDVSLDAFLRKVDFETIEQRRKTQLVTEPRNLARIIDELMI